MAGLLVLVVGPSGAGKDTLIGAAKNALGGDPRFVFPRRLVTRSPVPELEDHETISWADFATGEFALSWEAHGLGYALPRNIEAELAGGRVVVVNVSRKVLGTAIARHPAAIIVIDAHPDVRAQRLAGRGRESHTEIVERLARDAAEIPAGPAPLVVIDNSAALGSAVTAFVTALENFSQQK